MSVGGMVSKCCSCSSGSSRSSSSRWRSNTNIGLNVPVAFQSHVIQTRRSKLQASEDRNQQAAPLLDAVLARGNKLETALHVPGHKVCIYAVCSVALCLGRHCVQHLDLPALLSQKWRLQPWLQHTVRLASDGCGIRRHLTGTATGPVPCSDAM